MAQIWDDQKQQWVYQNIGGRPAGRGKTTSVPLDRYIDIFATDDQGVPQNVRSSDEMNRFLISQGYAPEVQGSQASQAGFDPEEFTRGPQGGRKGSLNASMFASNPQMVEEKKSGGGGPRFDPMRAQAFLDNQIASIWELVNAGIISMDEAQARYQTTIDEVYGRQQKVYEDAGTDVLADIVASQEAKQGSRDEIDKMMRSVGVDPARTAADRGARDEMDTAYARGREDLVADMARNIGIGQAGRTADAQEMFEQARTDLTLGGQQSEAELNQLFDVAAARAATLGVDPMMVFVDMMANTNDTGQVVSGRNAAAAEQKQMDFYTDIAQGLVDSGGFPGGMAEALPYVMGIIDKNYFNTGGSMGFDQFVNQYPHLIGPSQDSIQQAMKQYGLDYDQAFQMVMGGLMGELMNPVNNDPSKGGMYGAAKAM